MPECLLPSVYHPDARSDPSEQVSMACASVSWLLTEEI